MEYKIEKSNFLCYLLRHHMLLLELNMYVLLKNNQNKGFIYIYITLTTIFLNYIIYIFISL